MLYHDLVNQTRTIIQEVAYSEPEAGDYVDGNVEELLRDSLCVE